jgi:FKBP-type peptidyl-prolyl cis-trans isomerase
MAYMEQYKKSILDTAGAQLKKDDALIQKYLRQNRITNAKKTESGVYYVIKEEGTGPEVNMGDTVTVNYTGTFLDGTEFDKSSPERPFVFQTGVGNVIPGFDEGLDQLREGSKAIIIIPSSLAYGPRGAKRSPTEYVIPPNSVIVFDLEVTKVGKME